MASGGHEVDVGAVPDYKYVHNKPESEFLTGIVEYSPSCEHLGSCLAVEHSLMKSSMLFNLPIYVNTDPYLPPCVHLTST